MYIHTYIHNKKSRVWGCGVYDSPRAMMPSERFSKVRPISGSLRRKTVQDIYIYLSIYRSIYPSDHASIHLSLCLSLSVSLSLYIYIYIERERESPRGSQKSAQEAARCQRNFVKICTCLHIYRDKYIHMYTYKYRHKC